MPTKHRLSTILAACILLLSVFPASGVWGAPAPAAAGPVGADPVGAGLRPAQPVASVDSLVWHTLRAEGQADVIVLLRAQADLSAAAALPTKEARGRYVVDALRQVAAATQPPLRALLDAQAAEGRDYQSFYIVNAFRVRATAALVHTLAARPDVARIVANPWVKGIPDQPANSAGDLQGAAPLTVEPNITRVGAPDVWALGYTGQGAVVAGNDTGIDWDHPALLSHYRDQQPGYTRHDFNWHDAIHSGGGSCGADSPVPCDDYGHGTHTLGTLVGDDGAGNQVGMAPGAQWIGCRNMNVGYGTPATYIECFEFFLAPYPVGGTPDQGDPDLAPDVINNSWGCPASEGCSAGTLEPAVEALRQAGIAVVVSAGNAGSSCNTVDDPPSIYLQSFTVGAFNHATDQIAGLSSRGPVTYDGQTYIKPDLTAPGISIRSSVPGGGYEGGWSGTSMAAPHVAGAIALLLSAAPAYAGRVDALQQVLIDTAETRASTQCGAAGPPNNVWGWGILDVAAAVQLITSGSLHGTVTDAATTLPLAAAAVEAVPAGLPAGPHAATAADGTYTLTLPAGTYTLTVAAAGYATATLPGVVVTATTLLDVALQPAAAPHAAFLTNSPICLGQPLLLTNTSTLAETWAWTFGDGTGSAEWQPSHTYAAAGTYTVTLAVTNTLASDTAAAPAAVLPLPEAAWHHAAAGLTVSFSNDSLHAADFSWTFGDGLTSTLPSPIHTYPASGTYTVTLLAAGPCGQDSSTAPVTVLAPTYRYPLYLPFILKSSP